MPLPLRSMLYAIFRCYSGRKAAARLPVLTVVVVRGYFKSPVSPPKSMRHKFSSQEASLTPLDLRALAV